MKIYIFYSLDVQHCTFSYDGIIKKRLYKNYLTAHQFHNHQNTTLLKMQALTEVLYILDQSVDCQASIEVNVQVGVSITNVGTQVAPKSIEKGIVCISICNIK